MSEVLKKYRVLKPVVIAGRVEAGAIVELSEAEAANIGIGEYLEEVATENTEKGAAPAEASAPSATGSESGEAAPAQGSENKVE